MPGNWAYEFSGKEERRKPLATNSRAVVELVDGCRTSQNLQKDQRITPHRVTAIVFHGTVCCECIRLVLREAEKYIFTCEQNIIFQTDELSGLPDVQKTSEGW